MYELKVDSSSDGEGSGVAVRMPSQNLTASSRCLGARDCAPGASHAVVAGGAANRYVNGRRAGGVHSPFYNLFGGWYSVLKHCASGIGMEHVEAGGVALFAGVVFTGARGRCLCQIGRWGVWRSLSWVMPQIAASAMTHATPCIVIAAACLARCSISAFRRIAEWNFLRVGSLFIITRSVTRCIEIAGIVLIRRDAASSRVSWTRPLSARRSSSLRQCPATLQRSAVSGLNAGIYHYPRVSAVGDMVNTFPPCPSHRATTTHRLS